MKKKVIALILYFALLLSSVFPATALAEGGTEEGSLPTEQGEKGGQGESQPSPEPAPTEAPTCSCTTKCGEGAVDPACPLCSAAGADLSACKGPEPRPKDQEGGGETEPPKDQEAGQPTPAPTETPVCICDSKCC